MRTAGPHRFSALFARIDAGDLEGFFAGLSPEVEVAVAGAVRPRGKRRTP